MNFNEFYTAKQMILDPATTLGGGVGLSAMHEDPPADWGDFYGVDCAWP